MKGEMTIKQGKVAVWLTLLFLLLTVSPAAAQVGLHIDISAPKAEIDSTHVALSLTVAAQGMEVRSTEQYVVELVLQGDDRRWELPEVVYAGGLRYYYRERERLFADGQTTAPYHVDRKVRKDRAYLLDYRLSLPYEPWMEQADLVYTIYRDGRNRTTVASGTLIDNLKPVEEEKPAVWNLDPEEYRKMLLFVAPAPREKHRTLNITLPESGEISEHIRRQLDTLFTNESITVDSVYLRGYSSPDGPEQINARMARQRTDSLKERLVEIYGTNIQNAVMEGIGEDWAGLERLLRDTAGYEDALSIALDTQLSPEVKERILRIIEHGAVWKRMKDSLFPRLRRIEMEVDYTIAPWTEEQLDEHLTARPDWLSAEEIYRAAQRLVPGRGEYSRAYEMAVEYYPEQPESWVNAAAARLWAGDTEGAGKLLRMTPCSPLAQVNLGVYYYIAGDLTKAEQCFDRAAREGIEKGKENLQILYEKTKE
jgi:hypothetical protein